MKEFIFSEIYSAVITELAKHTGKKLLNNWGKFITDSIEKNKIDSGESFIDYLEYSSNRYSKVKTLIYSRKAEFLYHFYLPPSLTRYKKSDKIDSSNIKNLLDIGNNLIITGTGGIGKSLMLKHFFLDTIKNTSYVPVFIELRNLNDFGKDDINLERFIYDELVKFRLKLSQKFFEYSLESGCYVMLFDGLDELKSEIADVVIKSILDISDKYQKNYFIVSSRPWQGFIGWNNFEELEIMKFDKDQSLEMISKLNYDESVKENFIKSLDDSLFEKYESFATIPLLLTIMFLTYQKRPSLPEKLNDFYAVAFSTLFYEHDATKNGYVRLTHSELGYEEFVFVFSYFCFLSFFNFDIRFTKDTFMDYIKHVKEKKSDKIKKDFNSLYYLHDLTTNVCMLIQEGLIYEFSHRSFQEYFAAKYTVSLGDYEQETLLKKCMNEQSIERYSTYKEMLYDMIPDRYIKNVFKPVIVELYSFYNQNNQNVESLISFFVDNVYGFKGNIRVNYNVYYYRVLNEICVSLEYKKKSVESQLIKRAHENIANYLYGKSFKKEIKNISMNIDELLKSNIKNDIITYFDVLIDQSLFAMNIIPFDKKINSEKDLKDMVFEF